MTTQSADPAVTLAHAVTAGRESISGYRGRRPAEVTITENEYCLGVTISELTLTIVEGESADYTVVLDTQPTADVTITISGHSDTDITLSGATLPRLTFTADNWDTHHT